MSDIYNANSNKLDEEQSQADQAMEIISGVANQRLSGNRFSSPALSNRIQEDVEGAFSQDSVVIEKTGESRSKLGKIRIENEGEEEEPSNPRGFFYNFDYPVQLLLENSDDRQQRSVLTEQKSLKPSKNDEIDLNSSLNVEVADFKIVKRSENSQHIEPISEVDSAKDKKEAAVEITSEVKEDEQKKLDVIATSEENPIPNTKSKNVEAQIPVYVKVEAEDEPSDFLLKTEMELKRLATNEQAIDGVHDAQVNRRVQA